MDHMHLNEHDANQGAQSRGEFLGMSGNSGWYLLAAVAVSLLLVILCWGVLGVSLLLCLMIGLMLCALSLVYVFALKNNRPEHYDTDYFESVLIEAGVLPLAFGPRHRRIPNPFKNAVTAPLVPAVAARAQTRTRPVGSNAVANGRSVERTPEPPARTEARANPRRTVIEPVVPLTAYEHLRDELVAAEDLLEDALAERGEI
jgi:hypothetical protein